MSRRNDPKRVRAADQPSVAVEKLEERVALSLLVPKKTPEPPPYPPGTRYSLVRKQNVPGREPASGEPRKENEPAVERLEERVALSLVIPKKKPSPPPYAPGTLYGLAKRENIPPRSGGDDPADPRIPETAPPPEVDSLEERIALSLVIPKKKPVQPPYPPGADYSLVRRENLRW
ncbi:MAG: hypothetical protein JXP34_13555 [Planctomycetes bacterium]|nr:hypothetical protein [Planctomycetota bacterium]